MNVQRFYYSRLKLGGMTFALAAIFAAPGIVCILNDPYHSPLDRTFLTAVSMVCFVLAALIVRKFYKVCVENKPVVTIADTGFVDTRVSGDAIPWSDVQSVQFSGGRDRTIQLRLIPGARKRLRLRPFSAAYTVFLGVIGISSGPLAVRDSDLLRAIEGHLERSRAEIPSGGQTG